MGQRVYSFPLKGGLDQATPPLSISAGALIAGSNYEPIVTGGYRRIEGYEAFDGQPNPSDATFWYVYYSTGSGTIPAVGETITGGTSGTTSKVLSVETTAGTWGSDAAGYIVVYGASGLYTSGENLNISATRAVASAVSELRPPLSHAVENVHLRAAREATRVSIAAVPGAGSIRGVWSFLGVKYAIRDNSGQTAGVMFKSTASGWVAVTLGHYLTYTTGTITPAVGATITANGGSQTAVVVSVGIISGSFATNNAIGRVYVKSLTGGTFATGALASGGALAVTVSQTVVTLPPAGRYEFVTTNFFGATGTTALYGVNGVGYGFSYDGTDFSHVHTGMVVDKPQHVIEHKKHLFYSFSSSVQHSVAGDPYTWSAILGAAEISTGDDVAAFSKVPGDVLSILNRQHVYLLYGTSSVDWNLVEHSAKTGAIEWTVQNMRSTVFLDDRGINDLNTTQDFGDFTGNTLSLLVNSYLQSKKALVQSSIRIRSKDQYRLFFSDGSGLIAMFDSEGLPSFIPFSFPIAALVTCSVENASGVEELFFGSSDGFIYQMEKGDSFNGALISYFLRLPFANMGKPRNRKKYFKVVLDIDAIEPPPLSFTSEFSYGGGDQPVANTVAFSDEMYARGGTWGGAVWGEFVWGAQIVGQAEGYIDGSGINISLVIRGESNYERPHSLLGASYHYTIRGLRR